MPSRQRWQRPHPAWTSTATRSPTANSSTAGPELHDRAHVFVAGGEALVERQFAIDHRRQAVLDDLDVGRADRDRVDPHQHLGRAGLGHRLFDQRQLLGVAEHPGLHRLRDAVFVDAVRSRADRSRSHRHISLAGSGRRLSRDSRTRSMPGVLGAAGQRRQGPAQHAGLGRAGFAAESEGEIGLCRGEPVAFGLCADAPENRAASRYCTRLSAPISRPAMRRRSAWRSGSAAALSCRRSRRSGATAALASGAMAASARASSAAARRRPWLAPSHRPNRIKLTSRAGAVLDPDQGVGNAGPGIEGEREPPEGFASRFVFIGCMPHRHRPMQPAQFVLYGNSGVAADAAALSSCASNAPRRWISTSKP